MYFIEYLEQYKDKKIKLFVDMDGVIADYNFGSAQDYNQKRPLIDNINKLEIVSQMPNVEMYIFSATRYNEGFEQKHWWLDRYAPFFRKENRIIISREDNNMEESSILKAEYLEKYSRDDSVIIVIDDDPKNLKAINKLNKDIILLKDTVLVDDTAEKLYSQLNFKNKTVDEINLEILALRNDNQNIKDISDGYHTFGNYIEMRNNYFIALCNAYADISWKSKKHFDEEHDPMFNGDFIAGIDTPDGPITQHLKMIFWDDLDVSEIDRAPEYDGYTERDARIRIKSLKHGVKPNKLL